MVIEKSYLYSHTSPGKGIQYDDFYLNDKWHAYMWSQEKRVLDSILHTLFKELRITLLDFACGTGRITEHLEGRVEQSVGTDVSEAMLSIASKKLRKTRLHKIDLCTSNPFAPATFNLITAFRFFSNAEPELRKKALNALRPLLSQDGYLVFNNHNNPNSLYIKAARLKCYIQGKRIKKDTFSIKDCAKLLDEVGMQIYKIYSVGLIHIPRLNVPSYFYSIADKFGSLNSHFSRNSESPIIVARCVSK